MRAINILSGPPGAGKTTVAKLVIARAERGVHLHADDFWDFIASGFVPPWLPESAEQNAVVMSAVASTAARFARAGYETIVDGVVGPWLLDPFFEAARGDGLQVHYVVLRPSEDVASTRATERPEGLRDDYAVRKMHREFADLGELERHAIDTSEMDARATAAIVWAGLAQDRFVVRAS